MVPRRRAEFGNLLKYWRTLRKESQLALGNRTGVSSRHLSFLETGRAQPSREMVLVLAQSLDVPARDRNVLLRAAGFADVYPESSLDAPSFAPARSALKFILARHAPYPAMVIDAVWDVKLANEAARGLLDAFMEGRAPPRTNILRLLFDPEALRPYVQNWTELASALIRRLHRDAVGTAADSPLRALLAELLAIPGVHGALATPEPAPASLPFTALTLERGPLRLRLFSLISSFGIPIDVTLHDLRIETLFPADDATEAWLRRETPRG